MTKRTKHPDCEHQFAREPTCAQAVRNTYECDCGTTWDDEWSCGCDDDCPSCGTTVSPTRTVTIAECACVYLAAK